MIADHVIVGESIHPVSSAPGPGFVAIAGGRILAADTSGGRPEDLIGPRTTVTDAGRGSVVPGLHDNHTFFTSQLLEHAGISDPSDDDALTLAATRRDGGGEVFLRDLEVSRLASLAARIDEECVGADVVLLARDREGIALTSAATARLGDLDAGCNESLQALYAQLARDEEAVRRAFVSAGRRMHRGGVVSVKDIAFDTHLGMLPAVDRLLEVGELDLRYAFASQPVAAPADLARGEQWRGRSGARFHGFKLMTDGSFDEGTADLLPPEDRWRAAQHATVDHVALRDEAHRILDAGFRLALNADGDGAVRACLDIFEEYEGLLPAGCSLSDASVVEDSDAARIGRLGILVETYPQMLRLPGYDIALLERLLGAARGERLANIITMLQAPVPAVVSAATDFPLLEPSLPEAMLSASLRALGDGPAEERWTPQRGIPRAEVLRMWTSAAATAMADPAAGALAPGMVGDVVVFDIDLFAAAAEELVGAVPALVLHAGRVVHAR